MSIQLARDPRASRAFGDIVGIKKDKRRHIERKIRQSATDW
jgi:hypothetical protein